MPGSGTKGTLQMHETLICRLLAAGAAILSALRDSARVASLMMVRLLQQMRQLTIACEPAVAQPLGCQDREPQWVDLLYEPALGTFLEWHPVATFFGAYIKLLRQVRAMGIAKRSGSLHEARPCMTRPLCMLADYAISFWTRAVAIVTIHACLCLAGIGDQHIATAVRGERACRSSRRCTCRGSRSRRPGQHLLVYMHCSR